MEIKVIKTFAQLHRIVESYPSATVIYRGVKDATYDLKPRIGRYKKF